MNERTLTRYLKITTTDDYDYEIQLGTEPGVFEHQVIAVTPKGHGWAMMALLPIDKLNQLGNDLTDVEYVLTMPLAKMADVMAIVLDNMKRTRIEEWDTDEATEGV